MSFCSVRVSITLQENSLKVGFFFGMPLSVGERNARQHECSTHNLLQRERFTEQDCRHRRGQRSLCKQTDGGDGCGQMSQGVRQGQVAAELRN